ncbi:MAG: citryl-CoA lyase [Bacillati bacterium ANGP1]|uniref:citrate synthase (unknown stereospecificity) n=1 Tax=Candidatus Segetimicrobium genomatis TaxID=2569760 RepID=A0A537JF82_9BACT|nr:MAG: citryl-CoA lyase [Terrabacteria group bacterium ANGP1]
MDATADGKREPFHWRTAIAYKTKDKIVVRGYDLNELTGGISFAEMAYLVWRGELPSPAHGRMLDAILVSMAEHAFSPSSAASRLITSGGVPLHVGVAGGLLAIGSLHGTADRPAELFKEAVDRMRRDGLSLEAAAREVAGDARRAGRRLPGFHHPQHIQDPRTARLLELSDRWGVSNQYVAMARAIEAATESFWGRRIYLNGPGAVGAICLDLGFDTELIKGVFLLSRTVSLVAHTYEEAHREKGWRGSANASIVQPLDLSLQRPEFYDGPADRPLPGNRKGG